MLVQEPIQAAIWHCLNHYNYADAIFLSERLYAEVKTDESLFLLATSYYRNGQTDHAYHILKVKPSLSPKCRYLFGKCAYEMQKYSEAEAVLLHNNSDFSQNDELFVEFGDQTAFVLVLLAKIALKTERKSKGIEAHKKALKLNPFLWSSFVDLCNLGEKINPVSVFQLSGLEDLSMCHGSNVNNFEDISIGSDQDILSSNTPPKQILSNVNPTIEKNAYTADFTPETTVVNPLCMSGLGLLPGTKVKPLRLHYRMMGPSVISPQPSFGLLSLDSPEVVRTPLTTHETNDQQHKSLTKKVRSHMGQLINRKDAPLQNNKPLFSQSSNLNNTMQITPNVTAPITNLQPGQNVRRSSRLFSNSNNYSVKENNKSPNRGKFVTAKSPSRKTKQRLSKCNLSKNATYTELNARNRLEKDKSETVTSTEPKHNYSSISNNMYANFSQQATQLQKQSAEGLMLLLRDMGHAYLQLSQFNCKLTIEELEKLPTQHYETTWVFTILGLAYFEMADYENCIKYFSEIRSQEPFRLQYMDIYSTALWHLQKEVALSSLAQDLVQLNKYSPITWCVNGNCFSLHKEHDTAIKFFQRAVQVDPTFTYAYTLLGHEYIMTEELDKAMSCFRSAIKIDSRHYNAWFGIGTIYSKQERFHLAEINYSRAFAINPQSSVLMCHIGVVQHALKKTDKALNTLNMAIGKDPKNPLCKFHRGSIYFAVGRHAEALKELEELKEIVPKESLVYYLIGKVHKKLGNTDLALMHFSWATDLDPKGASSQIKEAFDPSVGRGSADMDSPASPTAEEYQSEMNSAQQDGFGGLPEDSDDSL